MKALFMRTSSLIILLGSFFLAGCSNDLSDTVKKIDAIKEMTTESIEPIPEIKIYEKYTYQSSLLRSPFVPDKEVVAEVRKGKGNGLRPNPDRNKEFLEDFPLDTLSMVGTISSKDAQYALVLTNDGLIHQVRVGNYLGLNDGEVLNITESGVEVREIVPDGLGGYVYRPNELHLKEDS